jgi:hypothetical protein
MANILYPKGAEAILNGDIDWNTDTIKVALVDTGTYTYSAAHDFLDDLSGVVGTAQTLGSVTTTGGVLDAANPTFTAVSGATVEAVVIYKDTGSAGTSPLLVYIDSATGLPVTPNGGDITVEWNASGILTLA